MWNKFSKVHTIRNRLPLKIHKEHFAVFYVQYSEPFDFASPYLCELWKAQ